MSKNAVIQIILYGILIIFLLSVMILVLFKREFIFSFGDYEKVELYNETYSINDVDKLNVDMVSTDITIRNSEDDDVKVIIYGKEERRDRYTISNEDKNLKISEKAYSSFCFGFCFYDEEVVVYLPESYSKNINIKGTSSDVNIMNNYDSKMDIQTVSGEINVQDANNIVVKSTSGDITINKAKDIDVSSISGEVIIRSGRIVKVSTTSGDISIDEAEETTINSTSGEVQIGKSGNVNISTMSGDIEVGELIVSGQSIINSTSGEILVSSVNDVYVETTTTSGDVKIENSDRMAENVLKIKTTSGDIVVR